MSGISLKTWALEHAAFVKRESEKRASPAQAIPLDVLQVRSMAGLEAIFGRFQDLGLAPGEKIEYFGHAPLGEPIFICVRETVIALRLEEAELIMVRAS